MRNRKENLLFWVCFFGFAFWVHVLFWVCFFGFAFFGLLPVLRAKGGSPLVRAFCLLSLMAAAVRSSCSWLQKAKAKRANNSSSSKRTKRTLAVYCTAVYVARSSRPQASGPLSQAIIKKVITRYNTSFLIIPSFLVITSLNTSVLENGAKKERCWQGC